RWTRASAVAVARAGGDSDSAAAGARASGVRHDERAQGHGRATSVSVGRGERLFAGPGLYQRAACPRDVPVRNVAEGRVAHGELIRTEVEGAAGDAVERVDG